MEQFKPMNCSAGRASIPGVAFGILRVLCNGICTAQRFHMDGEERRRRVGCHDESDSLSHDNECPPLYNITAAWRNAPILLEEVIFFTTSSLEPF